MNKKSPFTQTFQQLPNILPVFPLNGAVVLPGGTLALNIFEPRYLNMIHDAMKSDQLVGMIQSKDERIPSTLHSVGCAGRIIRYYETTDGRLEISLEGLCRFKVSEELSSMRGYRLVKPSWHDYQQDFSDQSEVEPQDSILFNNALRNHFSEHNIEVGWSAVEDLPQDTLVNNLVGQLPLSVDNKQLLLEAHSLSERIKVFTAILANNENDSATRH